MNIKKLISTVVICISICSLINVNAQAEPSRDKESTTKISMEQKNIANKQAVLNSIRYSKSKEKVRIVFDLNPKTTYEITQQSNGNIQIDFSEPISKNYLQGIQIGDESVPFVEVYSDNKSSCVVVQVADNSGYTTGELKNPRRFFVDIQKDYEYSITKQLEQGLTQISYYSKKSGNKTKCSIIRN